MLFKNKTAWLRIVESFTTILLIATVLLIILNKTTLSEAEKSELILDREYAILREVQLNNTLRGIVVNADLGLNGKIVWEEFEDNDLSLLKNMITARVPLQLICNAQLCELSDECVFDDTNVKGSIFTRSSIVTATIDDYSPKRLKLFCWEVT